MTLHHPLLLLPIFALLACGAVPEPTKEHTNALKVARLDLHDDEAHSFEQVFDFGASLDLTEVDAVMLGSDASKSPLSADELDEALSSGLLRGTPVEDFVAITSAGADVLYFNNRAPESRFRSRTLIVPRSVAAKAVGVRGQHPISVSAVGSDGAVTTAMIANGSVLSLADLNR